MLEFNKISTHYSTQYFFSFGLVSAHNT